MNITDDLELRKPLPDGRTYEQIKNHYLVEKHIAEKLRNAAREERKTFYSTMYDKLFSEVPDHPRMTKRNSEQATLESIRRKWCIVKEHIDKTATLVEFGPGDGRFAMSAAKHVNQVYGVDISDQIDPTCDPPDNFRLIVYDGYQFDEIEDNTVDVVFSDYLIEHLHPDDTKSHFHLVYRILKKGGIYIFRTPHAFTGPHDISQYFSCIPKGFHLKEWTCTELALLLKDISYSEAVFYWFGKGIKIRIPKKLLLIYEKIIGKSPQRIKHMLSSILVPTILCKVRK
jgi:ubiquinone/menaquinone biosynthesis C-methylase UbiE